MTDGPLPEFVLVSSYTDKLGHVGSPSVPHRTGITIFKRVPPATGGGFGELVEHGTLEACSNPSYMCANRAGTHVYVVSECYSGREEDNCLLSFSFKKETGELSLISTAETGGAAACHVDTSPDNAMVAVANYLGGSVALFALGDDGCAQQRLDFKQHTGASQANPDRQEAPHAHMSVFTESGRHLLVPDLGLDQVLRYEIVRSPSDGSTSLSDTGPALTLPAGSGPRHLVFHPLGQWVYILNELLSTIVVCSYNSEDETLAQLDAPTSTLPVGTPVGTSGKSFCAAIRISRDGRFLYASNRGHDSIAVFGVAGDGLLSPRTPIQWVNTRTGEAAEALPAQWPPISCPRDFALAGGQDQWVIVGNQDSDTILVLDRSVDNGKLTSTSTCVSCPAPICVLPLL
mmetsp:Transcript_8361/g.23488  ORF Transcript_8361/g.23488 Transcript_8361/m.23488 type:complete len:402 (-) Transcript_8361:113-1318(-)